MREETAIRNRKEKKRGGGGNSTRQHAGKGRGEEEPIGQKRECVRETELLGQTRIRNSTLQNETESWGIHPRYFSLLSFLSIFLFAQPASASIHSAP